MVLKCTKDAEKFMLLSWWCPLGHGKEHLPAKQFVILDRLIPILTHLSCHWTVPLNTVKSIFHFVWFWFLIRNYYLWQTCPRPWVSRLPCSRVLASYRPSQLPCGEGGRVVNGTLHGSNSFRDTNPKCRLFLKIDLAACVYLSEAPSPPRFLIGVVKLFCRIWICI